MADLLPSIPDTSAHEADEPRVVGLEDDAADEVFDALSSTTARSLFAALTDDPAHPSALADRVDTSLQNVQYHIEKMVDAGLVEVVDTAYSEKGREMDVYAPADGPLVVFAGDEDDRSLLSQALQRLLGGLAILSAASVFVQGLFGGDEAAPETTYHGESGGAGGSDETTAQERDVEAADAEPLGVEATEDDAMDSGDADGGTGWSADQAEGDGWLESVDPAVEPIADQLAWIGDLLGATGLEPGVALLVVGGVLLAAGVALWYVRETRV